MNKPGNVSTKSSMKHASKEDVTTEYKKTRSVHFSVDLDVKAMEKYVLELVEDTGQCSLWLILMLVLSSWPAIILAFQNAVYSIKDTLDFRCYIPELKYVNWTFSMKKEISMPPATGINSECTMYNINYTLLSQLSYQEALNFVVNTKEYLSQKPCSIVVSDHRYFSEGVSFVEKPYMLSLCTNYFKKYLWLSGFCGRIVTDFALGIAADLYGRKCVIGINVLISFLGLAITACASMPWSIFLGRILTASCGYTSWLIFLIYFNEVCSKQARVFFGQLAFMAWGTGYLITPFLLYYIQSWIYLHCSILTLATVNLFSIWFIPESPRWLMSKRKFRTAVEILAGIDQNQVNQRLPTYDLGRKVTIVEHLSIFLPWNLGKRIVKSAFLLGIAFLVFYSSRKELLMYPKIDIYNYLIILAMISLLHPLTAIPLIHFLGRKITIALLYILLTITYCSVLIHSDEETNVLVYLILINFSTVVGNISTTYTTEIYPVTHNGTIMGFCTAFATSFVVMFEVIDRTVELGAKKYRWLTICASIAAILIFFLPETSNKLLPLDEYQAKLMHIEQ